jgi:hypothetical protein
MPPVSGSVVCGWRGDLWKEERRLRGDLRRANYQRRASWAASQTRLEKHPKMKSAEGGEGHLMVASALQEKYLQAV